jgi:hypothetical protein
MTYQTLDLIFPYIMFGYGAALTLVLNSERLMKLAGERFPLELVNRMQAARVLSGLSLWLGGLWILQNLWFA